jgi:hypothetical protein
MDEETDRKFGQVLRGQRLIIEAINGLTDVVKINNAMAAEVLEILKKPPSSNMSDLIAQLVAEIAEMRVEIDQLRGAVALLPEAVARAVSTGEV